MRIYVSGSHSSGKSTICRYISTKYNLPMIPEVARMILSERELNFETLRSNLNAVDDYQNSIFFRQLEEESKQKEFVSDRSFDCLAYAAQHSRILSKLINSKEIKNYLEVLKASNTYIFFIRPSTATMKQDGVREKLSWDGIVSIDANIKFMLEMFDLRYFQINTESMQERVRLIDAVLSTKV